MENIIISFNLKIPDNVTDSIINTLILQLRDIKEMEEQREWDNTDTVILNNIIEKMKQELNNLKIKTIQEEKQN
jgi:hypothetical protein